MLTVNQYGTKRIGASIVEFAQSFRRVPADRFGVTLAKIGAETATGRTWPATKAGERDAAKANEHANRTSWAAFVASEGR